MLESNNETSGKFGPYDFARPKISTELAIFAVFERPNDAPRKLPTMDLCVFLMQREDEPFKGQWQLPRAFPRPGYPLRKSLEYVLDNKTTISEKHFLQLLDDGYFEQLCTLVNEESDPDKWNVSSAYMALINGEKFMALNPEIKTGTDISDFAWFKVDMVKESDSLDLVLTLTKGESRLIAKMTPDIHHSNELFIKESNEIAFNHAIVIACAVQNLRANLYTDMIVCLLPEEFTLSEQQKIYEAIQGKDLYKASFRKKVGGLESIEKTEKYTEKTGYRSAVIYKRR